MSGRGWTKKQHHRICRFIVFCMDVRNSSDYLQHASVGWRTEVIWRTKPFVSHPMLLIMMKLEKCSAAMVPSRTNSSVYNYSYIILLTTLRGYYYTTFRAILGCEKFRYHTCTLYTGMHVTKAITPS